MHVQEKQAWFMLIVAGATLALLLIMIAIFGLHPAVFGAFGLFGLWGFTPLIGRHEREAGAITFDERDRQIHLNATVGAYSVFWLFYVAAMMGPFFILGPEATIHVSTIMHFGVLIIFTFVVVRSLIVVVLYRRGGYE